MQHLKKLCDLMETDLQHFRLLMIDNESSEIEMLARDDICDKITNRLEMQPALISSFIVMEDFYSSKDATFTNPDLT